MQPENKPKFSKRKVGAVVGGIAAFAIFSASAATLGGINVDQLGADSDEVASPITGGVTIEWVTEYDAVQGVYVVNDIELEASDNTETIPENAKVSVTLADVGGGSLGEFVSTSWSKGWTSKEPTAAAAIQNVSVVINGGAVAHQTP